MKHRGSVLVFAELGWEGDLLCGSVDCVRAGRDLADVLGGGLVGLVAGGSVENAAERLRREGVDAVYTAEHPLLHGYHPESYRSVLLRAHEVIGPKAILMADTWVAADLAPRVAFALNTGLITDCVGFSFEGGEVCFNKPIYSGNVIATYAFETEPYMATLRPRVGAGRVKIDLAPAEIIPLEFSLDASLLGLEICQRVIEPQVGPSLAQAKIVVAGGRGIGGPDGFACLAEVARRLNGALGASRPPVDLGWVPPRAQVGQTGEKVAPEVYIAVAISGTTQHLVGMIGAKTIVAINKDPDANIFRVADYGVVGDYEEVIPAFLAALDRNNG